MSEEPMESLIVSLPTALVNAVRRATSHQSLNDSEAIAMLLTESLVYCHGMPETEGLRLLTPVVRLANAILVQALDNGIDTMRLVPTGERVKAIHWRGGKEVAINVIHDTGVLAEIPVTYTGDYVSGTNTWDDLIPHSGRGFLTRKPRWGRIRITHNGVPSDIGIRFLPREPGATGEIVELTFPPKASAGS